MTAANGPIVFNASTGSDTVASGLGPSSSRHGSGASTNNTTTVDLSADTPNLSVVSAGDMLWLDSTAGPQWSIIASVDDGADTVTCDDTFTQTEGSRTWAIGGKRKNWDATSSRRLFENDLKNNMAIETETDQSLTSKIILPSGIEVAIYGTAGSRKLISQSANDQAFQTRTGLTLFKNFDFTSTGTNNYFIGSSNSSTTATLFDCHAYDCSGLFTAISSTPSCVMIRCSTDNCVQANGGNSFIAYAKDCIFQNNTSYGAVNTANGTLSVMYNCVFANNTTSGYLVNSATANCEFYGCIFAENTGSGLKLTDGQIRQCSNNIFYGNGTYGAEAADAAQAVLYQSNNAWGNNTSGDTDVNWDNTVSIDCHVYPDITLTADPFTNSASGDFTLNTTAGGGALLRTKKRTFKNTDSTESFSFTGLADASDSAGGMMRTGMNGGMSG